MFVLGASRMTGEVQAIAKPVAIRWAAGHETLCATLLAMTAAKFYFAYFWFSSASGGRENFA